MRIALAQVELLKSKQENLDNILSVIKYSDECDIIVFPEMIMGGRREGVELYDMAEDVCEGDFALKLRDAASKYNKAVCTCLWEKSGSDKVYNTAVVFGSDGDILAKYRKLHLFDALSVKESDYMLQGGELPPVFEINGVNCGLAICYDLRFPEVFRSLSGNNADIFIVPSAWYAGEHKIFHLKTLLAARSIENTAYIACSNVSGGSFCGNSSVFDPFGIELESLSEGTDVIYSEINKKRINEVRKSLPCLENFRNDIF